MVGSQGSDGNSTYIVDGETFLRNPALNTVESSTASMLFGKEDLSSGSHVVTVSNGGVRLTLGYFKVQATVTSTQTPGNTPSSSLTLAITTGQATTTPSTSDTPSQTGMCPHTSLLHNFMYIFKGKHSPMHLPRSQKARQSRLLQRLSLRME